jgi:apolipoprotein N-acyltransferase
MALDAALLRAPFGGVPWGSWAATQPHTVAAAWVAPFLGGPGVVAVLVLVNAGWATLLFGPTPAHRAGLPTSAALLAAFTALLMWPNTPPAESRTLRALLVASDLGVPGPEDGSRRLRHYIGRTLGFAPQPAGAPAPAGPLLIVWPESAAADVAHGKTLVELNSIATLAGGDILLGSDLRELGQDYNSLFLVSAGRFDFQRYDKRRLVPFGEYVPALFRPWFGRKATRGEQDVTPGTAPPALEWREHRLGVAICFESILAAHVAEAVAAGAQVLANDAWLTPPASLHHLRLTALRALEAGRDALFASNGGWSALLRGGQVMAAAPAGGAPLAVEAGLATGRTLFARWGADLPLALAALALLARLAGNRLAAFNRTRSTRLPTS